MKSRSDRQHAVRRRTFLKASAAAGVGYFSEISLIRGEAPNDRLNIAIVGCGGRGASNMHDVSSQNIVALCDVNEGNLRKAAQQFPRAKPFVDFRQMYQDLKESEYDAVVVSTTEHTHAFATLPALRRKKHVYCEKPLTHNIREARLVTQEARRANVATQMGTQIHATSNYRRVVELIQSGAIGPVRECHVWVSRAWGWQSEHDAKQHGDIVSTMERPSDRSPLPAGLNWELWLGPAPFREFHEVYFPGPKWYRWWDWGSGTMSDLGSHWNDLPFGALKLDAPTAIEASGPPPHPDLAPASMSASYEYAQRGEMPAVKLVWYQGTPKPPLWTEKKIPRWGDGCLFVGDDGMLLANYDKHVLLPEEKFAGFKPSSPAIPESIGHHAEWLQACKTGSPTTCSFSYSGRLTEANHLGNVAYRVGKRIEWNSEDLRIGNVPEAEPFVGREYRKGWDLEAVV